MNLGNMRKHTWQPCVRRTVCLFSFTGFIKDFGPIVRIACVVFVIICFLRNGNKQSTVARKIIDMDLNDDSALSDDEEITAETVLKTLQNAWQNERLAPEILPHRNDMLECMLGQIQHMERNINKLPKTDLRACIHKMELNRIKFIICNYLKTRLSKIENYCISIVNEERQRIESGTNYLTPSEFKYAQEYLLNMEGHLKTVVLNKVPSNMQTFETNKMAIYPNLQAHVFLKANDTVNGVVLEDLSADQDEEIDLEEGSQHILQYKPIADLVKNGKVQLI